LIAAEGGTGDNHSEVVFRADSVRGPYAPFAENPILTQRDLDRSRADPITCTGHADFVQTQNREWWAVFLGCRPYEDGFTNIGRETFMLPVRWEDDWPTILPAGTTLPRAVKRPKLPLAHEPDRGALAWRDTFDRRQLAHEWNFLRTPATPWFSLDTKPGSLLVEPRPIDLTSRHNPSLIARRQQHAHVSAMTTIANSPTTSDADAGLVAFQNETHWFFLSVRIRDGAAHEIVVEQRRKDDAAILARLALPADARQLELRITARGRWYSFAYRVAGRDEWIAVYDNADGSILSTRVAGGFVGSYIGMFARHPDQSSASMR
jgi:alpha-N-arabinofuranosidase